MTDLSAVARLHLSQARAELAAARARCCSHGVVWERCREDHPTEGVGTGAGEGATGQDTGTAWVTRSTDYPEASTQAHPLTNKDYPTEIEPEETNRA